MKRIVCLSGVFLMPLTGLAGWTQTYGQDSDDEGYCVQQTVDGDYIIAGYSGTTTGGWILKTDENGDTLWTSTPFCFMGGTAYSVIETSDGSYAATGYQAATLDGKYHLVLIKLDSEGKELWTRMDADWVGHDSSGGIGYSVHETPDGGFVIAGSKQPFIFTDTVDLWLIKTDSTGELEWERKYGGSSQDVGRCVNTTSDGGYVVAGYTDYSTPSSPLSFWVLKTNEAGDSVWITGMPDWFFGRAYWVEETSDNGFISAGYVFPFDDGKHHLFLLKIDSAGDTLWSRMDLGWLSEYGGGEARCVRETSEGGFIITGFTSEWYEEIDDLWLVRTDVQADTQWTRTYGGQEADLAHCGAQTTDEGYIVVGGTESYGAGGYDIWLLKTDAQGDTLSISEEPPGNFDNWDVSVTLGQEIVLKYSNQPSGFHAHVFDASGRKVSEIHSPEQSGVIIWGQHYEPGVYFIRIDDTGSNLTRKVVIMR
ncbi:T9SS type A sorting domain-containing protein [candidate division WOR-3 bacterium]|nr:T9SS type A sorting domain-containing protein [candidate division WOR-3 bacterium]